MPKFTEEQMDAITRRGSNIIVSAGAGSGKTAVLTERVIHILKSGIHINQLLILTFTKAAASEMKERIRKAIKKDENLKEELAIIDSAYITTFDSFSLSILKKYHYALGIDKSVDITESSLLDINKKEILDKVFDEFYDSHDSRFLKMIDEFCTKDDKNIKASIFNIASKLELRYDREVYLNNYVQNYYKDEIIDSYLEQYKVLVNEKRDELNILRDDLSFYADSDYISKIDLFLAEIFNTEDIDDLIFTLDKRLPSLPRGSSEELKLAKEKLSTCISEIKELLSFGTVNEMKEQVFRTKDTAEIVIDILKSYFEKLDKFKSENRFYEFTDVAMKAMRILKENEDICEEVKASFYEILVDEYQDTNDLQERFISLISNNNVYMVGDVKQSIYRFRNANPHIFRKKYSDYSLSNGGVKIDLLSNFRSREEVIEDINIMFRQVMDEYIGGADYVVSHQMVFGNKAYLNEGKKEEDSKSEVWSYASLKEEGYSEAETEAFLIARDIDEKIKSGYKVLDKDTGSLRKAKYTDFVILMDRTSSFDLFKKIFTYLGVPLTLYKDESLSMSEDLSLFKNIIDFVIRIKTHDYGVEFRYDFVSIARSFLYRISDEEIFLYVKNNNIYNSDIYKDLKDVINILDSDDIYHILKSIIVKTNFYVKSLSVRDIEKRDTIVFKILELGKNLNNSGYDIYQFRDYLDRVVKDGIQVKYSVNTDSEEGVRIMTIHKSKGLEYPVCYFALLNKRFNISDVKDKFLYSSNTGIVLPYFDEGIGETFISKLFKENYLLEEVSEKIRLFYVAMTRAREKMIFLLPEGELNEGKERLVSDVVRKKYRSLADIMYSLSGEFLSRIKDVKVTANELTKDYLYPKESGVLVSLNDSVINVKELKVDSEIIEEKKFSKKLGHLPTRKEIENMNYGKMIHEVLEFIDFNNPNYDMISDTFVKNKIKGFFESSIMKNVKEATVYKEHEFIMIKDNTERHGIIDLMLEYKDYIDLVDYKLKNISDEEYLKQLNGYKEYLESVSGKTVNMYLYSVLDDEMREISELSFSFNEINE